MTTGTEQSAYQGPSSLVLLGGALQARTGVSAHPLWCKSLKTNEEERTSGSKSRRYFFDTELCMPGQLAGFYNVQQLTQPQPSRPNHMIGFFDDITIDPAFAGSICVLNTHQSKNPALGRDFYCTKKKLLSGDHYA